VKLRLPNGRWTPRNLISCTNAEKSSLEVAFRLSAYQWGIWGIVLANVLVMA